MVEPLWRNTPGTLTAEVAKQLPVPEVLQLVAERLWLVVVRLAAVVPGEVLAGNDKPARGDLNIAEAALSDALVGLRAIYAAVLHSDAQDAHSGVVVLEDSVWMWREMVRGLRMDLDTLPKGGAELSMDFGTLAYTVRLHARAVRSVAHRAQRQKEPEARQLQLVPTGAGELATDKPCPGCGVVGWPHGEGCAIAAQRWTSCAHAVAAARLAGFTNEQANAAELLLWNRGYVFEPCREGDFAARHLAEGFIVHRSTLPALLGAVDLGTADAEGGAP